MESKFISYDINTQKIIKLENERYMQSVLEDLQSSIVNYVTKKLSEQEIFLFNFPESTLLLNNNNLFYDTVQKLVNEIKKSKIYFHVQNKSIKFKGAEKGELDLDYGEICGIVNYIICIIDNLPKKNRNSIIHDFCYKSQIPKIEIKLNKVQLSSLIEKAKNIKTLRICLSNKNSTSIMKDKIIISIKVIQLFCLFFNAFFSNLLIIELDLNVYEINKYFNLEINPYNINTEEISKVGHFYKTIILGNLIIMKNVAKYEKLCKISFKMYDSYQIELHNLMSKYFTTNIHEIKDKKNNNLKQSIINDINNKERIVFSPDFQNKFLFFQHILPKLNREFFDFDIEFNSLDPLLFSNVNILLIRYASLANISIKFFDFNQVSYRKILINSYYYNFYSDGKKNPLPTKYSPDQTTVRFDNDYKIYYDYINNITDNENSELLLLRDEVILNELFPYFNYNLNTLLIIIENKLKDETKPINSLTLDFISSNIGYKNLNAYNNYNTSIICFIYNLLNILEINKSKCNLSALKLELNDLDGEKEFIFKNIQNKFPNIKKSKTFDLSEIKLRNIYFNITNISLILPFSNYPLNTLSELIVENLSYYDLNNFVNCFRNNKLSFKNLMSLELTLNLMIEDFRKNLEILLKECISNSVSIFKFKIPCNISYEDIINIITWTKKSINKRAIFFFKLSHYKISPTIGDNKFNNVINEFKNNYKKEFHNRNIITGFKCEEFKKVYLSLKLLNNKEINYYIKFIHCFNKTYSKSGNVMKIKDKGQKIFENIFYYMGKFKKTNKEIRLQFI